MNVMLPSQSSRICMLTYTLPSRRSPGRALFAERQYRLPSTLVEKENWESRGISSARLHCLRAPVQVFERKRVLLQLVTDKDRVDCVRREVPPAAMQVLYSTGGAPCRISKAAAQEMVPNIRGRSA